MKENSIEEEIKIALDKFLDNKDKDSAILIVEKFILGNYILRGGRTNIVKDSLRYILSDYKRVLKENEELKRKNEELKVLYIRTAKHQEKIGHTELAGYMLAQIEAVPTFTTWEEYTTWVDKDKIREFIKNELPDDEIMKCCSNYDVNGVRLRKELQKLLEEK